MNTGWKIKELAQVNQGVVLSLSKLWKIKCAGWAHVHKCSQYVHNTVHEYVHKSLQKFKTWTSVHIYVHNQCVTCSEMCETRSQKGKIPSYFLQNPFQNGAELVFNRWKSPSSISIWCTDTTDQNFIAFFACLYIYAKF